MEFNHKCWNPLGELSFILGNDEFVYLRRCCLLKPFLKLSIQDFLRINDPFKLVQEAQKPIIKDVHKDSCKVCYLPKTIEKVTVGLSKACPLNCYHCFYENNHKDTPEIKKLYFITLEKIKGHHLKEIRLNDRGEPFYYYNETIKYLRSLSLEDTQIVSFITGLSTLNELRIKELKAISDKTNIKYRVEVSIDGITKESYEATRLGGNFEKVMSNLKTFTQEFGSENIIVNYVIKQPNFSDKNIKEFFIQNFNIKNVSITYDIYDKEAQKRFEEL